MSLPVQMAMKSSNAVNPPAVLPLQQSMQMLPHAQAQAQAQAMAQAQAQGHVQPGTQLQPGEVTSVLAETTSSTWLAIGSLAESLGDLEKASSSYDTALRHSPNNPEALTRLANIYRSRDHFLKAAELYEQALNFHPDNGDTWGLLGHCYLMMDDLQRAYAAYQRALYYLDNPNVPKLWHGIGILYDRYGSLEYAEEAFVRVLDLDPNFDKSNEIYFRLGIIYKHQGKLPSALECFQYILSNPPHPLTQPDVWFQIGSVLEQQKNWTGAEEAYKKVLEVNPNHAKVLQQLGCLYSQAEASPSDSAQQNGQKPFQQDLAVALKYLTQSIEIDSTDAHSWYYLGRVHMIRGDFNAAYEAFQQAVNRDSRNPTFWCSIGVLYYQISQYRDALDAYTRAIRLNPYISEVWYDLGTLYETCNNQISDALDAYRQAERLDPGNPHIQARLEQLIKYQQDGNTHPPQPPPVNQQPRLPQGMVLESTQPPSASGPPGPPGPPGHPQGAQQLHGGPSPAPQLQLQQQPPQPQHQQPQHPPHPQQPQQIQPQPNQPSAYPRHQPLAPQASSSQGGQPSQSSHPKPPSQPAQPHQHTQPNHVPIAQVSAPPAVPHAAPQPAATQPPILNQRPSPSHPTPVPQLQTSVPQGAPGQLPILAVQPQQHQHQHKQFPEEIPSIATQPAPSNATPEAKSANESRHASGSGPATNGVSNGTLKHDLDDKQDPAVVKKPHTAEAFAESRDATKSAPNFDNPHTPLASISPEAKQSPSSAPPVSQNIVAPVAQHLPQTQQVSEPSSHQHSPQPAVAPAQPSTDDKINSANGASREQDDSATTAQPVAIKPVPEISKGVSPMDESKSITPPVGGGNAETSATPNLPNNVEFGKGKAEAVTNDDEEEDEEEAEVEPVEPPMRKVDEDENYDED